MCLIVIAHALSEDLPLVVAANRDEDYDRPTLAAGFWPDAPDILGGRDARARGTWLAVSRAGRFAAVTNLRAETRPGARSRGLLVSDFVRSRVDPRSYAHNVGEHASEYAGFHLVAGVIDDTLTYVGRTVQEIEPGSVFAISNAPAEVEWEKVDRARRVMTQLMDLTNDPNLITRSLLQFLSAPNPAAAGEIDKQVFVSSERYGTRSSTVIVATRDTVHFNERSYSRGGAADGGGVRVTFAREA
jgi:uncharacterized protein with NRDE domain